MWKAGMSLKTLRACIQLCVTAQDRLYVYNECCSSVSKFLFLSFDRSLAFSCCHTVSTILFVSGCQEKELEEQRESAEKEATRVATLLDHERDFRDEETSRFVLGGRIKWSLLKHARWLTRFTYFRLVPNQSSFFLSSLYHTSSLLSLLFLG